MKRLLPFAAILVFALLFAQSSRAQNDQIVTNGNNTAPIIFPGISCQYSWSLGPPFTQPFIGLTAMGTGNIPSFTAINNTANPITVTITATPQPSGFAYVPCANGNDVSVIDTKDQIEVTTIPVGTSPNGVSISPDGTKVFVTELNDVTVISTATNAVIGTITGAPGHYGIAVSPDGNTAYAVGGNTLVVMNASTYTVTTRVKLGEGASGVAVSPDGTKVYVTVQNDNTVDVINTATNTITAKVPVGQAPVGVALSPDGSRLYVVNYLGNNISVINTATNQLITAIGVGSFPVGITVSPDGSHVYVSNAGSNNVSVISTATLSLTATVAVGNEPVGISATPDGTQVYVANESANSVSIINTATNAVVSSIPVEDLPISFGNFVSGGSGCGTAEIKVKITVNPTPAGTPVIITGTEIGSIVACTGQPSASPDLQQFTVSGNNLSGLITATSPPGFEISLLPGSGYGNSVILGQAGAPWPETVFVRSTAADPAGSLAGNVVLTSPDATAVNVPVTGTVFALPTVNPVTSQTVNDGAATTSVNFTGTGNIFTWTNDTPGIGLAAAGTGNIGSFKAINTGVTPITATITVTPSPAGFAYIPDSQGNVSVINTTTNAVVSTIHVGNELFGVTVSPDNSKVYITNQAGHSELISNIAVINTQTSQVASTIDVDLGPLGIALNGDGSRAYVINHTEQDLQVVNTITQTVLSTLTLGDVPFELAVTPDGNTAYVGNADFNYVWVINTLTNQVTGKIPVGMRPSDLMLSPDGTRLYVANVQAGNISVINTSTNTIITTINTGGAEPLPLGNPWGMTFSPDGSKLYAANYSLNTVMVINTASNTVTTSIPVGNGPAGTSVTADGSRLYVVNYTDGTVSVINTATNKVITTITVGANPWSVGNFISAGTGCTGTPIKFTITVNPNPLLLPTIDAGVVTGTISACPNEASASPNIQQFTVAGGKLTGNITVTAPAGFEVSLSAAGGFSSSVALASVAGLVNTTIIYVRSAASATTGAISGPVVVSSPGAVSQNVIVNGNIEAPVDPSVSITVSANNICAGTPVTFNATPANGGTTPVYQWQVNSSNAGTNSATFASSSFANGDVVTCIITSNAACAVPVTATSNPITMVVDPIVAPSVSIAASAPAVCAGTAVTFIATPINGGNDPGYQWVLNGSNTGTNSPEFTSSTLANGDVVSCILTSNAACIAPATAKSNSITMTINPLPIVSAGSNKSIYEGGSTVLDGASTGNIASITWSPSKGLSNTKILTPVANPTTTTTYFLTVETTSGCISMDSVKVEVAIPPVVIPNTFTPNGDGVNDTWDIKYLSFYPECSVQVFTRWGQKVYSSIGYPSPWDGRLGGAALPIGTYYYIIDLGNSSKLLSGYVVIIR